ncbi:MAG: PH domain-containing protein [Candidatus Nanohalobium sp.]
MKLAKASIPYRALKDVGTLSAVLLFSGNFSLKALNLAFMFVSALVFVAVISVSLIWRYIVWSRYEYFFEEDSLKITQGVFRRNEREIPYRRIQNAKIDKNIIQRVLGIAKVDFETAGGANTEASLKYVTEEKAREIQRKVREFKKEGKIEEGEEKERKKLFEFSERDLLAYSFLSINTKSIGLGLAGFGLLASFSAAFVNSISIAPVVIISFLALILLAGIWIVNAVTNYIQYYGFKLWQEEDTLEYERGLLNRSEGSIPLEKIQGLSIDENFLKRQWDYATLKIETAGGVTDQQKNIQSNKVAIPLARKHEVLDFGKKLEGFNDFSLSAVPSRARRRYFGRYSIGVLFLLFIGFLADLYFIDFSYLALLGLLPLAAIAAHLKWLNKGFEAQEDYFISMNGFWIRKTSITPYYRIQNLIQTETVLQKRWDLSTLTLDTAGSMITGDSKAVDLDIGEAEELRSKVFEKFEGSLRKRK